MKKALPPTQQPPQKSASETSAARIGGQATEARPPGNLGRLAATINASQQVQTQLKLAKQFEGSAQNQKNLALASAMNQAPAQRAKEREKPLRKEDPKKKPTKASTAQPMAAQLMEAPAPTPNRTGLPDQLKAGVENLSGISLDDVRVHYDSAEPAQLNALAYAQGADIHVAPGQEQHLPHEAWHIVQQKQGRVQPTTQMKAGVPINDDPKLEHEADVMGSRAAQRKTDSAVGSDRVSEEQADGHSEGCACPACSTSRQLVSRDPAQRMPSAHGIAQLKCEICDSDEHDNAHCPELEAEEEEETPESEPGAVEVVREKVPGWKKKGGGAGAPTGRIDRSGISHHNIGKDKSKSKKERDMTSGRKGKKKVYKK